MVAKYTKKNEAKMEKVERHFAEHPSLSLRQAVPNVSVSMSTHHEIFKYDMKHKFYHIISVQRLQETHKEQRHQFCQWLLDQDEDLVQRVIWTDKKIFVLHQKPHRKNDGHCGGSWIINLFEIWENGWSCLLQIMTQQKLRWWRRTSWSAQDFANSLTSAIFNTFFR